MSTEPTPKPIASIPPRSPLDSPELENHEVAEVLDFLKENGVSILVGVGLAVVAFVGWSAFRNYRSSQEITAGSQLFGSQATEQFQQIVDQYPSTAAAPLAKLSLAGRYFDDGQYELAQHQFSQFAKEYPDHPLRNTAELGAIQSLEALGRFEEAADAYGRFALEHKGSHLEGAAVFGRGRSLEQLGRWSDAKAAYEDFLVANPGGPWAARTESVLQYLDKQVRAGGATPVATTAPLTVDLPLVQPTPP